VPKGRAPEAMAQGVPITTLPRRNTIFLSFALAFRRDAGADDIFVGVNAIDYSGYPDCRPEYSPPTSRWRARDQAGIEGRTKVKIHAPLMQLDKAGIIRAGWELASHYSLTWSCYDPTQHGRPSAPLATPACCRQRLAAAGVPDPLSRR